MRQDGTGEEYTEKREKKKKKKKRKKRRGDVLLEYQCGRKAEGLEHGGSVVIRLRNGKEWNQSTGEGKGLAFSLKRRRREERAREHMPPVESRKRRGENVFHVAN